MQTYFAYCPHWIISWLCLYACIYDNLVVAEPNRKYTHLPVSKQCIFPVYIISQYKLYSQILIFLTDFTHCQYALIHNAEHRKWDSCQDANFSSLATTDVALITSSCAESDDKVGITTTRFSVLLVFSEVVKCSPVKKTYKTHFPPILETRK